MTFARIPAFLIGLYEKGPTPFSGYSGGIASSAMDGILQGERIIAALGM